MSKLKKFFVYFTILFSPIVFLFTLSLVSAENNTSRKDENIRNFCEHALEFYLDRPDLEAEFLRRLEYCKSASLDISPLGYKVNPIISDFKSMFGVNGRTRMQIHQGIDILGKSNQLIIAIADGIVLETEEKLCEGPSLVIDHGKSITGEKLIAIYTHTGDFLVKEGDIIKRGMPIAKLPEKISFPCMARVRHLHLQIGQQYCEKEEKNTWGCDFFIKDKYSSLNPHLFWEQGKNNVTCYDENKKHIDGTITYPFACEKTN